MRVRGAFRLTTACLALWLLSPLLVRAGGDPGTGSYEIGEKLLAGKNHRTALKNFQRALRHDDARGHFGMALLSEAAGKDRDALSHYQRFMDIGEPGALRTEAVRRAVAIEERLVGKTARAAELLDRGKSLFGKGNHREAKRVLLQAAAEDKASAETHFYLGEVHLQLGEYAESAAEFAKAKRYYAR